MRSGGARISKTRENKITDQVCRWLPTSLKEIRAFFGGDRRAQLKSQEHFSGVAGWCLATDYMAGVDAKRMTVQYTRNFLSGNLRVICV